MVANALDGKFSKGDAIAIDLPMTVHAVIVYLAIVLVGCVVVSIADSFAPKEIASRLRISNAKAIFTQVKFQPLVANVCVYSVLIDFAFFFYQDFIVRGGRKFPLYRYDILNSSRNVV